MRLGSLSALLLALTGPVDRAHAQDCSAFAAGGPPCGAEPVGSVPGGSDANRFVGNPIDVVTGNKYQYREDFRAFGSRLGFSRHYNTAQTDVDRGLGRGWRHDFDVSIARAGDTALRMFQSDGRQIDFEAVSADAALAAGISADALATGDVAHLPANARDGYVLFGESATWHMPDGRRLSFAGRYLVRIDWPDGDVLDLAYRRGRLESVTDRHDRAVRLDYTPGRIGLDGYDPLVDVALPGHLERVTLPNGEVLDYRYDNRKNLTRVDYRGEPIERMTYGDEDYRSHLTELVADGVTKAWHYDDEGRGDAYADEYGSVLMLQYVPEPMDSSGLEVGRTFVRRTDGAYLDYRWSMDAGGSASVDAVIEHGCATCVGVPRSVLYDRELADVEDGDNEALIGDLSIVRLAADRALVSVEGLDEPVAVGFDRRARPVRVQPSALDLRDSRKTASLDGAEGRRVAEAVSLLGSSPVVTPSGTMLRTRRNNACPLPVFRTCAELQHDRQLALLSDCAYSTSNCAPPGWTSMTPNQLGVTSDQLAFGGFFARGFRNDVTGEIVVAFRGTEDITDFIEDWAQVQGEHSPQYVMAADLSELIARKHPNVTYTGHSLGGGLATTAAAAANQKAITFNPAALTPATAERLGISMGAARRAATNIVTPKDIVTSLQDIRFKPGHTVGRDDDYFGRPRQQSIPAPGPRFTLQPPDSAVVAANWVPLPDTVRPFIPKKLEAEAEEGINMHFMTSVLSALDTTISAQCGGGTP